MITGTSINCELRNSKRNFFLSLLLLLLLFFIVSEESTASSGKLTETIKSTERPNISLNNEETLNETDIKTNDLQVVVFKTIKIQITTTRNGSTQKFCIGQLCVSLLLFIAIISIPSIIILTVFILFLSHVLRRKQNYQTNADKSYASGRLMQLQLGQQNSFKVSESAKFTRDTETSADEVKPLRNLSEESELSRSVMASTSSEQEDENGSQRRKSLIKKRRHY